MPDRQGQSRILTSPVTSLDSLCDRTVNIRNDDLMRAFPKEDPRRASSHAGITRGDTKRDRVCALFQIQRFLPFAKRSGATRREARPSEAGPNRTKDITVHQ